MSIINQVLHDLEARHSQALEVDEAWEDLAWHNGAGVAGIAGSKTGIRLYFSGMKRLLWRIVALSIIAVLVAALSMLLYQQYGVNADAPTRHTKTDQAQSAKKPEKNPSAQSRQAINKSTNTSQLKQKNVVTQTRQPAKASRPNKQTSTAKPATKQAATTKSLSGKKPLTNKKVLAAGSAAASSQPAVAQSSSFEQPAAQQNYAMLDTKTNVYNNEAVTEPANESADPNARMNKTVRPLTRAQRAELAYQAGYTLIKRNHLAAGEAKLQIALRNDVRHIKAREMLIGMYIKTGRVVEAKELLKKGLLSSPEYTNFAKFYARMLWDEKDTAAAIAVLTRYAPNLDVDPDYHAMLAASLQRNEQHRDAARIYVQLLKIRPREGIWWVGMGISLEALGKEDEALQAYVKAKQSGNLNARLESYSKQRLISLSGVTEDQYESE